MEEGLHTHFMTDGYPPRNHMLRDLSLEVVPTGKGGATIQAPVVPEICSKDGCMYVGLLATLVDVLGGVIAIPAVSPDWISTSNLSIHTTQQVLSGRVAAHGHVLRSGRTSVVIGVELQAERAAARHRMTPAGFAMISYSRLAGNKSRLQMKPTGNSHGPSGFSIKGEGLHKSFVEKAGIRILDPSAGRLILKMDDYVRNSLGSLQGGMTALLGNLAGEQAAKEATGRPGQTLDLVVHYMSPGTTGPFQTRTDVLRVEGSSVLTRVHVLDQGDDKRLMAIVMNSVQLSASS